MNNSQLYRTLFLIDETRNYTNDFYIFEFVKIILFQEGWRTLTLENIKEKIEELTTLEYTYEDIIHAISIWNNGEVEIVGENYALSTKGTEQLHKREKTNSLKVYINQFLDTHNTEYNITKDELENLLEKFIYQRFNENLKEISDILNHCLAIKDYDNDYDEHEKQVINEFLNWDNSSKNKCVYSLIAKAYDYCMINSKCQSNALDFSKINLYLDTNIIFRLMGINGSQRESSVKSLIDKSRTAGINLKVSNFVKEECEYTINSQIQLLIDNTTRMNSLLPPTAMSFAEEKSISMDFYRRYYDWVRDGNKHRNYDAFTKTIRRDYNKIIEGFESDDKNTTFRVVYPTQFVQYYDSLYLQKQDKHTTEIDVNSVLMILEKRKTDMDKESFLISADQKLISWLRETFPGQKAIADFPSAWLSIILKYIGREKESDYKAFCQFIHLSLEPKTEDVEKKIAIKTSIINSDLDTDMKTMLIEEVRDNYNQYKDYEIEKIVRLAFGKTKEDIANEAREESNENHKKEMIEYKESSEQQINELKSFYERKLEESNAQVLEAYRKGQIDIKESYKQEENRKLAKKIARRNQNIRTSLTVVLAIVAIVLLTVWILMWLLKMFEENSNLLVWWNKYKMFFDGVGIIIEIGVIATKIFINKKQWLPTDEKVILNTLSKKDD